MDGLILRHPQASRKPPRRLEGLWSHWGRDFKVSGLFLVLCFASRQGWTHMVTSSPEGFAQERVDFTSTGIHWLCYCGTAELRTGSSSPWKWLHAQKFRNWMPLSNTSDDFPRCFPISSSSLLKVFLSQRDKWQFCSKVGERGEKVIIRVFWKKELYPGKALLRTREFMTVTSDGSYQGMPLRQELELLFP